MQLQLLCQNAPGILPRPSDLLIIGSEASVGGSTVSKARLRFSRQEMQCNTCMQNHELQEAQVENSHEMVEQFRRTIVRDAEASASWNLGSCSEAWVGSQEGLRDGTITVCRCSH
jgi:hypothetical protein